MSTSQLVQFSGRRIHDAVTWIAGACDSLPGMTMIDPTEGLSRRGMLTRSAAGLGIALSGSVSGLFGTAASPAVAKPKPSGAGYGPLIDDPAGKLSLPEGFEYKLVAESGVTQLESGERTPSDPDGTAAFVRHGGSGSVLVMNHENSGSEPYPVPHLEGFVYDSTHGRPAARRTSRSTATASASASTSRSPARARTAPAAARRGTRG